MHIDVPISGETIKLGQFLKLANLVESGGHAKEAILATSSNVAAYRGAVAMGSPVASVAYSADQREVLLKDS